MEDFTLEDLDLSISNAEKKYQQALLNCENKRLISMLKKDVRYLIELREEKLKMQESVAAFTEPVLNEVL